MRFRPSALGLGLTIVTLGGVGATVAGLVALDAAPTRLAGSSFAGPLSPLDGEGQALRERIAEDVRALARGIGERNTGRPVALAQAATYVAMRVENAGLRAERQVYVVDGVEHANVYADVARARGNQLLIGAHYDSAPGSPGGNDNASGVAVVLALAERFDAAPPDRWLRFVLFVNEEPPHFRTATMGSRVFAAWAAERDELPEQVVVLDSVGAYSTRPGWQRFPSPRLRRWFGDRGDFVAFIGNRSSQDFLLALGAAFRRRATIGSEGAVFPTDLAGVTWSDHASFWRYEIPAVLVTDTAVFRDAHYHQHTDRGEQIDFLALTHLTQGLEAAIRGLGP